MSFTNWLENKALNHILSKATYSPGVLSVGLCSGNPGEAATGAACQEVANTNGYDRVQTSPGEWNTASGSMLSNTVELVFPTATGSWGWIRYFVILDSGTVGVGNVLFYGVLSTPQLISVYRVPKFGPGALQILLI